MNEKRIARYSLDSPPPSRTDWERLRAMSDEEVEANALSDPDNPPATPEQLAGAAVVTPEDREQVPVSLRLDPDVIDFFKAQGCGYQSRINAVLRDYVQGQRQGKRA